MVDGVVKAEVNEGAKMANDGGTADEMIAARWK